MALFLSGVSCVKTGQILGADEYGLWSGLLKFLVFEYKATFLCAVNSLLTYDTLYTLTLKYAYLGGLFALFNFIQFSKYCHAQVPKLHPQTNQTKTLCPCGTWFLVTGGR